MSDCKSTPSPEKLASKLLRIIPVVIPGIIIGLVIYRTISTGKAVLVVESVPEASVYINGEEKGVTPLELELSAEEVALSVVSRDQSSPAQYVTKVKLTENVKTIVRRKFGESEVESSTQIVSFNKAGNGEASIAVVSIPDGVEVSLDGQKQGATPLKFEASPGEHTLSFRKNAYEELSFQVVVARGYEITAVTELALKLQ